MSVVFVCPSPSCAHSSVPVVRVVSYSSISRKPSCDMARTMLDLEEELTRIWGLVGELSGPPPVLASHHMEADSGIV